MHVGGGWWCCGAAQEGAAYVVVEARPGSHLSWTVLIKLIGTKGGYVGFDACFQQHNDVSWVF
jgi:hypothetical protein